ncbi:sensor histidine kinase [Lentibacillus sp. N15]|uniref:sensor histidine kinase n=1 Tax=Lentibacillus songyuanensis TaxID=3136161 RepID=UPI0031BA93D9
MKRISLQTKILVLITSLVLFVTVLLAGILSYIESKDTTESIGNRALNVATAISFMPTVKEALEIDDPAGVIQPLADQIREKVGAEYIVIGDEKGVRYAHPDENKLGKHMVGGDNDRAVVKGKYYTSRAVGSLGPALRGKAPIFNDQGDIIGLVSVGFMVKDIKSIVLGKLIKISGIALLVLVFGIVGGIILARNIRKDTLGLEPHEIASLYRDRDAILHSIKEGVIAVDKAGYISMINPSARKILSLNRDMRFKKVEEVIPNTQMYQVLKTGALVNDEEMHLNHREIIVNRTPIIENGEVVGVVASFRDKTEVNEMLNALSDVRKYSEDLRAQTHEFTNKLYVLSGLLQLGHYDEAIELIQQESDLHVNQNKVVLTQVKDKTVQAILLGKISKASEKKISFVVDDNSSLETVPKQIDTVKLIMVLGNVIDNALEAVEDSENGQVTFFTTDLGKDIVFEIADNGGGIAEDTMTHIFDTGFSTKSEFDRGYGLATVRETVDELRGVIEVHNQPGGGAVFSVFIPKKVEEKEND